jgi:hypothetical protein
VIPSAGGPAGAFDVLVSWTFDFDGEGTVPDLATEANVTWGPPVRTGALPEECIIWDIKDSCVLDCASGSTGACGATTVDGVPVSLACDPGPERCGGPVLNGVVPAVVLLPNDEIVVILRPAPGALPDGDTSDDSLSIVFGVTGAPGDREPSSWAGVKTRYR